MTQSLARPERVESGRKGMSPPMIALPADPFYSAMVRMLDLGEFAERQAATARLAKQYAAKRDKLGLELCLSLLMADAKTIIAQCEDISAQFGQHEIEDATEMYGVKE